MRSLFLFLTAFILSPINWRLLGFTISDFLLVVFILANIQFLRFWKLLLLQFLLSFLGLLIYYNGGDLLRIVFYYKFFLLLFLFGNVKNLSRIDTKKLSIICHFLAVSLGFYVIYYVFHRYSTSYSSLRVNFPFSQDLSTSDAHLYSYFLFVLFSVVSRSEYLVSRLILVLLFVSSLLTGSRTGTAMMVFWIFVNLNMRQKVILLSAMLILLNLYGDLVSGDLVSRATDIGKILSGEDMSLLARLKKWEETLVQSYEGFGLLPLTGVNIKGLWLDNLYLMYYLYFGIIGLAILFFWVLLEILDLRVKKNGLALAYLVAVIISNGVTEYVLTTRGLLVTFVGYLFFIYGRDIDYHERVEVSKITKKGN